MIIGLTGNIGSGKSKAAAYLQKKGAYLIDADKVARQIVEPGRPAWQELKKAFGEEYFSPQGELDRKKLAGLVFNDVVALQKLNAITHPAIIGRCKSLADAHLQKDPNGVVIIEAALFIEADMLGLVDSLLLITADEEVRLARIQKRDKLDACQAAARIASQMSEDMKRAYANHIIENNSDEKILYKGLDIFWQKINPRKGV